MDLLEQKKAELKACKTKLSENEMRIAAAKHDDSERQLKLDIARMQENVAKLLLEIEKRQNLLNERENSGVTMLDVQKEQRKLLLAKQEKLEAEIKELEAQHKLQTMKRDVDSRAKRGDTSAKLVSEALKMLADKGVDIASLNGIKSKRGRPTKRR